jgi:hypothetical protein
MVVTDLHGDLELYKKYRDHFLRLRDQDQLHTLVICGDYIHSEESADFDQSLAIVLDMIDLKRTLGTALIVLLGNHELPHIYHIPLIKGAHIYTPRFEGILGEHRQQVVDFFDSLPFWVRTKAGVTITHAGAFSEAYNRASIDKLSHFSHQDLLDYATQRLNEQLRPILREMVAADVDLAYDDLVKKYLSVDDPADPRYDDFLLGFIASQHPDFSLLWSALFTANEHEYGQRVYTQHVKALLAALSQGYYRQKILIAGHIGCRDGYHILANNRQLRLASGVHAHPVSKAKSLIFDTAKSVSNARALLPGLLGLLE